MVKKSGLDVVVIGGGTCSFNILHGLRSCPGIELHSIVTMTDSGDDSGELRDADGVLARGNSEAVEAIPKAHVIAIAQGDLYISIISNSLVAGIPEAIQAASAPVISILNLMTKHGETDGWTASWHVRTFADYTGRLPTSLLVHRGHVSNELLARYNSEKAEFVEIDHQPLDDPGVGVHMANLASTDSLVRHDPPRTAVQ